MNKLGQPGFATTWRRPKDILFDDSVTTEPDEKIVYNWEKKFAWLPVKVHGDRKWMTTVYRRRKSDYGDQRLLPPYYEYGNLFDVLRD